MSEMYWNCNSYELLVTLNDACQQPNTPLVACSPFPPKYFVLLIPDLRIHPKEII